MFGVLHIGILTTKKMMSRIKMLMMRWSID